MTATLARRIAARSGAAAGMYVWATYADQRQPHDSFRGLSIRDIITTHPGSPVRAVIDVDMDKPDVHRHEPGWTGHTRPAR